MGERQTRVIFNRYPESAKHMTLSLMIRKRYIHFIYVIHTYEREKDEAENNSIKFNECWKANKFRRLLIAANGARIVRFLFNCLRQFFSSLRCVFWLCGAPKPIYDGRPHVSEFVLFSPFIFRLTKNSIELKSNELICEMNDHNRRWEEKTIDNFRLMFGRLCPNNHE